MRKKKSEMTPVELVDQALKGRSWDEAETAGEKLKRIIDNQLKERE